MYYTFQSTRTEAASLAGTSIRTTESPMTIMTAIVISLLNVYLAAAFITLTTFGIRHFAAATDLRTRIFGLALMMLANRAPVLAPARA